MDPPAQIFYNETCDKYHILNYENPLTREEVFKCAIKNSFLVWSGQVIPMKRKTNKLLNIQASNKEIK